METVKESLSTKLNENLIRVKESFSYPINHDFIVREFHIPSLKKDAVLFYLIGTVSEKNIEEAILTPLLKKEPGRLVKEKMDLKDLLPAVDTKLVTL